MRLFSVDSDKDDTDDTSVNPLNSEISSLSSFSSLSSLIELISLDISETNSGKNDTLRIDLRIDLGFEFKISIDPIDPTDSTVKGKNEDVIE